MRAGVAEQGTLKAAAQGGTRPGILADEQGTEVVAHRCQQAAERVAGHGGSGGGLAPADGAVRAFDAHHDVEGLPYRYPGHCHGLAQGQSERDRVDATNDQRLARADGSISVAAGFHAVSHVIPRTRGMWMNSQGDGIGPTGTSISVGPSRRLNARLRAARSSGGFRARSASAPKLCPYRTKSGLARSFAINRLP